MMSASMGWGQGTPSRALTKTDMAYISVREQIFTGQLAPGALIDQEVLAASLGLSTTPVREALRRLESEHLVVTRAHRDTVVATLSAKQLQEVYEIRMFLDPYAVQLAAQNATDAEREEMAQLLKGHRKEDAIGELHYNRLLHRAIYGACGNETLIQLLDQLWDLSDRHRYAILHEHSGSKNAHKEHGALIRAVIAGDDKLATELMRKHVLGSLAHLG